MKRPPIPPPPPEACLLHRPRYDPDREEWTWVKAEIGYRTCQPCADRLGTDLRAVRDEYARLTPEPLRNGPRTRAAGFGSRSPANDLAIALTDRRNPAVVEPGDVPDVVGELHSWARIVRDEIPLHPLEVPASITTESGVLLGHLPWITRQPWVDEFTAAVKALLLSIRAGNGESPGRVRVGPCPDCSAMLYLWIGAETIRCGCGASWHKSQWAVLGRATRAG